MYGLLSDGGVHSHITHLYALLKMAKDKGVKDVFVHCFMDGRDVSPTSGVEFIKALQSEMQKIGVGKIASVSGRYYAMDRDNRWERVEKAYDSLTVGNGVKCENAAEAVEESYKNGVTDEFVLPTNVYENGKPVGLIEAGDSIIFFNFRPDRARELTRAFTEEEFTGFERKTGYLKPFYVCFTRYDATFKNVEIAFKPQSLKNTLGEYLSNEGYRQLRIAETEKYAHVTFFFNGGTETQYPGEDRVLIPSPREYPTYDLIPEMSAVKVKDELVARIRTGVYDMIVCNFANCDMVGHTGVMPAAIQAVECVDCCLGEVVAAAQEMGYTLLVTADHGNADRMVEADASPNTAHTTNLVPLVLVGKDLPLRAQGRLSDIAPTMLDLMHIESKPAMTGESLIEKS